MGRLFHVESAIIVLLITSPLVAPSQAVPPSQGCNEKKEGSCRLLARMALGAIQAENANTQDSNEVKTEKIQKYQLVADCYSARAEIIEEWNTKCIPEGSSDDCKEDAKWMAEDFSVKSCMAGGKNANTNVAHVIDTPPEQGPYSGPPGFGRGMNTTMHCGNNPESWVRGSASLDTGTGVLTMTMMLETDSTRAGPKGTLTVIVKDSQGHLLTTATTPEIGIGGKPPGGAVIQSYSGTVTIPQGTAQAASALAASVQCTGNTNQIWGIPENDVIEGIKLVAAAVQATGGN